MSIPTSSTATSAPRRPDPAPAELFCHRCGYDLRVQPVDGVCPECATPVADSVRVGQLPRRPAWRHSDPRWRRRLLIGLWLLVLLPVFRMVPLEIPIPTVFDYRGVVQTLADTEFPRIAADILFCVGIVLLFSQERFRRPHLLDRTRSIGVIGAYAVTLLVFSGILFIWALVAVGIGALFVSMPLKYQPSITPLWNEVWPIVLRHGPHPGARAALGSMLIASTLVLLACVPVYLALRSTGLRILAYVIVAPTFTIALGQAAAAALTLTKVHAFELVLSWHYYDPVQVADTLSAFISGDDSQAEFAALLRQFGNSSTNYTLELTKWLSLLVLTLWLTAAQFRTWLPGSRRTPPGGPRGQGSTISSISADSTT